ncbi:hypothetical protein [Metabacillus schmidteae]|uniref:hypothetical protein n=1 Tax=Metabacillus schmidteae TaxID=2730405 RepID=UPI00158CE7E0|nr:hypothetical protein [Metabacillus schmidteae]
MNNLSSAYNYIELELTVGSILSIIRRRALYRIRSRTAQKPDAPFVKPVVNLKQWLQIIEQPSPEELEYYN